MRDIRNEYLRVYIDDSRFFCGVMFTAFVRVIWRPVAYVCTPGISGDIMLHYYTYWSTAIQ